MKSIGIRASVFGIAANFILFLIKLYVGISSNSLSVYCDAVNNFGDTLSCAVALIGFILILKLDEIRGKRAQSLCAFVISAVISVTGIYFVYNGIERLIYPLPVDYSNEYALLIFATIFAKIIMGVVFIMLNKKENSVVLKALILDSFLDCFITLFVLMGLFLVTKVNFAVDAVFAVITGMIITGFSIKNIITETKYLING